MDENDDLVTSPLDGFLLGIVVGIMAACYLAVLVHNIVT